MRDEERALRERLELEGCTPEEVEYGVAFWDSLAVGELEPDEQGLDPERADAIRKWLRAAWWRGASRMIRGRR